MPQIECTDVTLAYERGVVLRDLSFTVERGDYLCIVGENGSGKSTLAKALLGLKAPLSGRIVFDETLRRRGIGYLPQQSADRSDFPASVWEVTLSGRAAKLGLRPFYTSADKESALQSLRRLGIEGLKKQPCSALSGVCCSPARSAPATGCCCSTSRWRGWTRPPRRRCTASSASCTRPGRPSL